MPAENREEDIFIRLRKILALKFKINEAMITRDSFLIDDLGVDSIDFWEVVAKVEEEFDIEVPDDQRPVVNTVQDVVRLVEERMKIKKVL